MFWLNSVPLGQRKPYLVIPTSSLVVQTWNAWHSQVSPVRRPLSLCILGGGGTGGYSWWSLRNSGWQRRWLEEEDLNRVCSWSLMEKKKFVYCLEEEGGFKESILLCTETSPWTLFWGPFRARHVLMPQRSVNIAWCVDLNHGLGLRHSDLTRNLFYDFCRRCWCFYILSSR